MSRTPSRYNISVPLKGDRALVYNSLSGAMALWEAPEVAAFGQLRDGAAEADLDPQVLADLHRGGFICKDGTDELEFVRGQYNLRRYNKAAVILTIAPTMACNFGCDYCFQGQDKAPETMSQEVQDAIVHMVANNIPSMRNLSVSWYGGEPLLRRKVIEELSDRLMAACAKRKVTYSAMVVTNGFLLDADTAVALRKRHVTFVQVTLDGPPEHHDARRHLLSKKGTFERLVANLRAASDAVPDCMFAIRVNIDERNHRDIHRLIDLLDEAGLGNRKNIKMYFAAVEAMTEGCHTVQDVTMAKQSYGRLEADLIQHGYDKGLCALPYPPRFHGNCGAVKPGGFVILPTGDVHKCWDTVSWSSKRVGTVFDLEALSTSELAKKWLTWTPFDNETCRNCKILPNCAGACAYKFVHAEDTRGEAAVLPCPSWKYNIKERLLHRAVGKGLITAADYDATDAQTIPSELCAEVFVDGGNALPEEMQRYYAEQKQRRVRLPVVA